MKTLAVAIASCSLILFACDKDNDDNDINNTDRNFTMMAQMSNFAEIDAGSLASAKAQNEGIRMFGQHMVTEHTQAKTELMSLAQGLSLNAPDSLDAEHVALKAQLMAASGRMFDSIYIHAQVRDHQKTIALFEDQVDDGENDRLQDYARAKLPHLREHLAKADSLAKNF